MAINVMLVEDEPHIRKILKTVIEKKSSFKVVYECDNMTDALLGFNEFNPMVIFMDIEINGSSGIDCAKVISQINPEIKIIFATAHSEYMSNAFEMYAFDYLIKPFNIERIGHTLERIEKQIAVNSNEYVMADENCTNDLKSAEIQKNKEENIEDRRQLLIKGKDSLNFISINDIVMIERENSSTCIYTAEEECYHTSMSLTDVENKLDMNIFIRSHKSYIINREYIKKIEPYGRWTYIVKFKGMAKDALITKEKYDQIKKMYL